MPYTIHFTNPFNPRGSSIAIADSTADTTSTSLTFIGKNFPGYAQAIGDNFLHLLENFASPTQPPTGKSVVGQLWFDSQNNQLKVFDGQNYTPAGNIFKSYVQPVNKTLGDLWVDLTGKQLFFWSGASWVLIGPQFSEGLDSGPIIEQVKDTLNVDRTIIKLVVSGQTIIILSKDKFVPKLTIEGFLDIKPGVNLSSKLLVTGESNKFWGTAEKAAALLVGNNTVDSSKFLRSDTANFTNYKFSIRSDEGMTIGPNNNISLNTTSTGSLIIFNNTDGSSINFKTFNSPNANDVLTLQGPRVGINNLAPTETLDVVGTIKSSSGIKVTSTTDIAANTSITNLTGSFVTSGGVSIGKKLFVGSETILNDTATAKAIIPSATTSFNLGDTNKKWQTLFVSNIIADNITVTNSNITNLGVGSITESATKLLSSTTFSIAGDVSTVTAVQFDGSTGGTTKTFNVEIDPEFLNNKAELTSVNEQANDLFLVYQSNSLKKTTRTQLFAKVATVPIGTILPFAGPNIPTGYLLCDGAEVLRGEYPELYSVIGDIYNNTILQGAGTFKIPDLRGRFALGRDTMNNGIEVPSSIGTPISLSGIISSSATTTTITGLSTTSGLISGMTLQKISGTGAFGGLASIVSIDTLANQITIVSNSANTVGSLNFVAISLSSYISTVSSSANRITDVNGDSVGGSGGNEKTTIALTNLPEHTHDLQSVNNTQFGAMINNTTAVTGSQSGVLYNQPVPNFTSLGSILTNSGGVNSSALGEQLTVLNPYLAINYIIFTGRFI